MNYYITQEIVHYSNVEAGITVGWSHGEDEEAVMISKKQGVAHVEASFFGR